VPVAVGLAPLLQFQQFDLQQSLLLLVILALHPLVIRVVLAPGVDGLAARLDQQLRIVVIVVADAIRVVLICQEHRQKVSIHAYSEVTLR
jgi:hypothetical protein